MVLVPDCAKTTGRRTTAANAMSTTFFDTNDSSCPEPASPKRRSYEGGPIDWLEERTGSEEL
jgi:hypothetical protein